MLLRFASPRLAALRALVLAAVLSLPATAAADPDRVSVETHEPGRECPGEIEPAPERDAFDPRLPIPCLDATRVRAGERAAVRWDPLGPEVEEFELILSLDDGRHWSLRVSPELEFDDTCYVWDVPNLDAQRARLRVRARVAGHEVWGPVGPPFRMAADPSASTERWLFWESARWELDPIPTGPGLTAPVDAPDLRAGGTAAPVEPPARALAAPPAPRPLLLPARVSRAPLTAAEPLDVFRARARPLRA